MGSRVGACGDGCGSVLRVWERRRVVLALVQKSEVAKVEKRISTCIKNSMNRSLRVCIAII